MNGKEGTSIFEIYSEQKINEFVTIRGQQKMLLDSQASISGEKVTKAELVSKMIGAGVPEDAADVLADIVT